MLSVLPTPTSRHSRKVASFSLFWQEVNKRQRLDVIMKYMSILPFEIKSNEMHFISKSKGSLNNATKCIGKHSMYLEVIKLYLYMYMCLVFLSHREITPIL